MTPPWPRMAGSSCTPGASRLIAASLQAAAFDKARPLTRTLPYPNPMHPPAPPVVNESGLLAIRATSPGAPSPQPFTALLDCGASFSAINWAAARLVGLPARGDRAYQRGPQIYSLVRPRGGAQRAEGRLIPGGSAVRRRGGKARRRCARAAPCAARRIGPFTHLHPFASHPIPSPPRPPAPQGVDGRPAPYPTHPLRLTFVGDPSKDRGGQLIFAPPAAGWTPWDPVDAAVGDLPVFAQLLGDADSQTPFSGPAVGLAPARLSAGLWAGAALDGSALELRAPRLRSLAACCAGICSVPWKLLPYPHVCSIPPRSPRRSWWAWTSCRSVAPSCVLARRARAAGAACTSAAAEPSCARPCRHGPALGFCPGRGVRPRDSGAARCLAPPLLGNATTPNRCIARLHRRSAHPVTMHIQMNPQQHALHHTA
jgi:hypothetical protein